MIRESDRKGYIIHNDLVYKTGTKRIRLVVPESYIETCLETCHDDMGGSHLGFKKTWPKVRDRFYWKNMYRDTYKWFRSCTVCAKRKSPQVEKIGLNPINVAEYPFLEGLKLTQPVALDFKKKWTEAKERIKKVNDQRKVKFDEKYKEKVINIGDKVRMEMLATKPGQKFKLRSDIWAGPFPVVGKYENGNLKIDIGTREWKKSATQWILEGKRRFYITHPDRLKMAESEFKPLPFKFEKQNVT